MIPWGVMGAKAARCSVSNAPIPCRASSGEVRRTSFQLIANVTRLVGRSGLATWTRQFQATGGKHGLSRMQVIFKSS